MSPKAEDLRVNVCKKETSYEYAFFRSWWSTSLVTPRTFSLEESLEFLNNDEMLEVTPKNIRIRKTILSGKEEWEDFQKKKITNNLSTYGCFFYNIDNKSNYIKW